MLCSNRCASLLKVSKLSKALGDADKCIELRPSWEKGYFRKGSVLETMSDFQAAAEVYRAGASKAPGNRELSLRAARMESLVKQNRARHKAETKASSDS
jgi:predicted TPR repeat methyltransferase